MCSRPFGNIEEHDECIIAAWNDTVAPGDTIYHLGDFAYRTHSKRIRQIFDRLHGEKHLILGNHDHKYGATPHPTQALPWASQSQLTEVVVDGQTLVLCHYALRSWRNMRRGAIQLFGHSHGRMPGTRQSTDVGVDVMGYVPVTLPEIKSRLAMLPALDFREGTDAVDQLEKNDPTQDTGYGR